MLQYIDKDALVAEIERRIKSINSCPFRTAEFGSEKLDEGQLNAYNEMLSYLDTLEVKNVDLEDEYMVVMETAREKSILDETRVEYFANGNPTIAAYSEDNLRNQFDAGADWMKKQIIKTLKEK